MTDLAGPPLFDLDDRFVQDLPELAMAWEPQVVPSPARLAFNGKLAEELGLDADALQSPEGLAVLAGATAPVGATPVAMGYAGHQFGGYSPRLGDGRAVLLGELTPPDGSLLDVQLKGSGRTPFARGGDGKATVGPMLREFLFAEAMQALGIPTTRALAVVTTGEPVRREVMEPGAVLTRVAASHLRVGSFEYAARLPDRTVLKRLADHTIARHHPDLADAENPYLGLLERVADAQAHLVAQWMLVGFIHGVVNTDNVLISGETIDYGPCAFMDRFDSATVFSSIDHAGRYAYGNQPAITRWNLTRLAETLVPLIHDPVAGHVEESSDDEMPPGLQAAVDAASAVLDGFSETFLGYWQSGMRQKLGLAESATETEPLFDEWLGLLHTHRVDYTSSFRALADGLRGDDQPLSELFDGKPDDLREWITRWKSMADPAGADAMDSADAMDAVNPLYIPRNHLVDAALVAATAGDTDLFHELLGVVVDPYTKRSGLERYEEPAPESFNDTFRTFCGT